MPSYLFAVSLCFLVWAFIFLLSKNSRKEMVLMGAVIAPFVIMDVITVPAYWSPVTLYNLPVGIEGFLFTFFIVGIASVVYELILRKRYKFGKFHPNYIIAFLIPLVISLLSVYVLELNVIYFFVIGFFLMSLSEVIKRRDLLKNSIYSSLFFGFLYFILFSVWIYFNPDSLNWWNHSNLSSYFIGLVPVEEVLFSLSLGAFVGPLYEYLTDAHLRFSSK